MLGAASVRRAIALAVAGVLCGCTGLAMESTPGGDGPASVVSAGGLAVDPRNEMTFVMQRAAGGGDGSDSGDPSVSVSQGGPIYAIDPDAGTSQVVTDLTGLDSIRVLFPRSSVMIIGENLSVGDVLMRFDDTTLSMTQRVPTTASFWGTRTSPTGTYVAVADNSMLNHPINVIEADMLAVHAMPWGGGELEAMWLNHSDTLVAILFDGTAGVVGGGRIMTWSLASLAASGFATSSDGTWASPTLDVPVSSVGFDLDFSYTWIAVSPDDTTAVFPVLRGTASGGTEHQLLVVNLASGAIQTVDNAYGPVGFTPDGTTIVSYTYVGDSVTVSANGSVNADASANASVGTDGGVNANGTASGKVDADVGIPTPQLLLIDTADLSSTAADIPSGQAPTYFVTREGNDVVVASNIGSASLVVYDITMHQFVAVGGPPIGLNDFVNRIGYDQLWLVDQGLYCLNFATAVLQSVPLSWTPLNINILPMHDWLVLDDAASGAIRFFAPSTRTVARTVSLPLAAPGLQPQVSHAAARPVAISRL